MYNLVCQYVSTLAGVDEGQILFHCPNLSGTKPANTGLDSHKHTMFQSTQRQTAA